MENSIVALVLAAAIGIVVFLSIRVAKEHERFGVFTMGRYVGLKGPGLIVSWPASTSSWTRISVGDAGEMIGSDVVRISDVRLPAKYEGRISSGASVRITGFTADAVTVEPDPNRLRKITCERCGHEMTV